MFIGSHQVVSKHSILGAQKDKQKKMEFRTEGSQHSEPEWIEKLEEIKQSWVRRTKGNGRRSRRDHAPCRRRERRDEVSEKLYEIYLDQRLRMLQQFYVTEKPGKPNEEEETEPEAAISETDEAKKEDKENADCILSLRLAIAPKQNGNKQMEKNLRNLNLQISDVVESLKQVDDELETKQQMIKGESVDDDNTAATVAGDLHALPPEPPEPPDRGLLMTEGVVCDWKEQRLTLVKATENFLEEAEQDSGDEIPSLEESTPEETSSELPLPPIYGAAMDERPSRELLFLSHEVDVMIIRAARMRYTEWVEKKEGSDWEERGAPSLEELPPLDCGAIVTEVRPTCAWEDQFHSLEADACELRSVGVISFDGKSAQLSNIGWVLQVAGGLENKRNHRSALLAVPTLLLDHFSNYFFILQLSPCLHKQNNSKPIRVEAIEQLSERKQGPASMEHKGFIMLDNGEVKEEEIGRIFCTASQLLFKGVCKLIELLVGVGRNGSTNKSVMVMPPLVYQWDPSGLKQNVGIHESATFILEYHGNQTHHHHHSVFLKFQQKACLFDDSSGDYMSSKISRSPVFYNQMSIVVEFIVDQEMVIGRKCHAHRSSILVPSKDFALTVMSHVLAQEFQPLHWTSLRFMVVKMEHIQWEPGGNYYSLLMCLIESLSFKLWKSGGIFFLLEYLCPIQEIKMVMTRQVAHEDVEILNNWNGILLFHNFISHQVIMLALIVILNCKWGAHKSDEFENITQVWLQTRQEIWVEHLIQELGSSRRPMREAHYKQWDPGKLYLVSCIVGTSYFKLWDPGGRVLIVCFGIFTLRTR